MTVRSAPLAALVCALATAAAVAQAPPPKTPLDQFRAARELIVGGKFDLAAEQLKTFLASNPTDADLLDIQARYGSTVFERLRLIPVWSEDAKTNADALNTVDELIGKAREAAKKARTDPARLRTFVYNLGATREERIFAEQELIKAGPAAVRPMLDALKTTDDNAVKAGILAAVPKLNVDTVPGLLAALPGLDNAQRADLLTAVIRRPDAHALTESAETDPRPWLWYYVSGPASGGTDGLRVSSVRSLTDLVGDISRRPADAELVNLSRPFYDHKARFLTLDRPADRVTVWSWDATDGKLVDAPRSQAEANEYYGLRNLRWAIERNPNNVAAQEMFLSIAVERAVERTRFAPLFNTEVQAYQLLAATPTAQLVRQTERAMQAKRTAEVFGLTQGLADRADRTAASPTEIQQPDGTVYSKPPVLVKALDYPDPRVQLVAAIGLLRTPGPPTHGKTARVIEVLRRALAADPPAAGTTEKGRALIADPSTHRADKLAGYLRRIGYGSERFTTGRALLARIREASDFDVVVVDRHIVAPQLIDVLAQMRADANLGKRPVLVVASADAPKPVPVEHQILRLAVLIAATESEEPVVDTPFFLDPRKPVPPDLQAERKVVADRRDVQLEAIAAARLSRLQRLVRASDLPPVRDLDQRIALRVPQLTYAVLATEFPVSAESAPRTAEHIAAYTRKLENLPPLGPAKEIPTVALGRLIEQLESAMDAARRERADRIYRRLDVNYLGLPADPDRDLLLEARLARQVAVVPAAAVIPEPYGVSGLNEDVVSATADPAARPRDPAEKRMAAKYAVEWLRRVGLGDVPGYDVRPAEPALREALRDDELADPAIDAVARIPTTGVQEDLLTLAMNAARPTPVRFKAADRAIQHVQNYGKYAGKTLTDGLPQAIRTEKDGELRGKLLVLHQLFAGQNGDLGKLTQLYAPPAPGAAAKDFTPPKPE